MVVFDRPCYEYVPMRVCARSKASLPLLCVKPHTGDSVAVALPGTMCEEDRASVKLALCTFLAGGPLPLMASAVQDTAVLVALDFLVRAIGASTFLEGGSFRGY